MPEPEPYYEPSFSSPRPSHYSTDSYASSSGSTELLKKATAGSANTRRLPPAPRSVNGNRPPPPVRGLPADPRPPKHSDSDVSNGYPSSVSRTPSSRPPGALAPSTPGYGFMEMPIPSPAVEVFQPDDQNNSLNVYHHKLAESHHYQLPASGSSSNLGLPKGPSRRPSREYLDGDPHAQSISGAGYVSSPNTLSPC